MAKSTSVWGIDLGQAALKALRCRMDGDQVIAEAFDYIEYPKILTQPEAEPESLVAEALQTFISRNDLKKTKVALSVPGQNGLAKFFKPPPVELKKVGDIVKYEARQQIPFDLQDVVWDYQLMAGAQIENNFALESEVGLFAMKRDAVYRTLKPLQAADIEVDVLQLAPLSIYNAITYEKHLLQGDEESYDSDHPPRSIVILAMGTDATDLIITNGYRVWQRSMPLGGNHFTRQLTKDLKLTFAKAEHLKRNAMEADDPKLIFQAMRPVFNDLVTEIQRSIGFFRTLNKKADIGSLLMLGNSVKLPGLTQYLSKNLAMEVSVLDKFERLAGDEVVGSPAFHDHVTTFSSVYGLCLQGLNSTAVYTNLVPKELFTERLIRSKKPWVVATAATLMLGMAGSLLPAGDRFSDVHPDKWKNAVSQADSTKQKSDSQIAEDKKQLGQVELLSKIGGEVSGSRDRRVLWLEVLSAIDQARGETASLDESAPPDPKEVPFNERETFYFTKVDSKYFDDLSKYQTEAVEAAYESNKKSRLVLLGRLKSEEEGEGGATEVAAETAAPATEAGAEESSAGWVFEIAGYHYHNAKPEYRNTGDEQDGFVLKNLIERLEEGTVKLPVVNDAGEVQQIDFTFKELGISHPMLVGKGNYQPKFMIPNPEYKPPAGAAGYGASGGMGPGGMGPGGMGPGGMGPGGMGPGGMGSGGMGSGGFDGGGLGGGMGSGGFGAGGIGNEEKEDPDNPRRFEAPKYSFKLQFIWREKPVSARMALMKAKEEEAARKAAEEGGAEESTEQSSENVAAL